LSSLETDSPARLGHGASRPGAHTQGISTRSVEDPFKALGLTGISKSQVSRLCAKITTFPEWAPGERLVLYLARCRRLVSALIGTAFGQKTITATHA